MTTTTHRIAIDDELYQNASNGNLNCTLVISYPQQVRLVFAAGDVAPDPNTEDYVPVLSVRAGEPRVVSISDLTGDSDVWVRSESDVDTLLVMRGEARIIVT